MRTSFARRVVLSLLISAALIGSNLQPIMATTILAQNRSDPGTPDRPTDPEVQISGPTVDASLERAPDPDKAVVIDQANPDWRTVYGTEAGRQLLPPRRSEVPAAIEGAAPPLTGFWSTQTIQAGTQGVTAVAYAPDGRLFAGLSGLGLHVYSPTASSLYQWTSITATPGGLVSNNVTALAVFGSQLWIGTGGSGISVYNLSSGTWITYTVANSPLPNNTINRITPVIDPNGADYVWISTSGGGAAKYTPGRPAIWNIINSADSALISNTMYFDVAVDINGATTTTWFATTAASPHGMARRLRHRAAAPARLLVSSRASSSISAIGCGMSRCRSFLPSRKARTARRPASTHPSASVCARTGSSRSSCQPTRSITPPRPVCPTMT